MFKAGRLEPALDRALDSPAATATVMVALLAMPAMASSGVGATESREAPRFEAYQAAAEGPYNYQMRCWQHGRLVSEQFLFELPADRHPMTESGNDRHGLPVYVAQNGHATCRLRSVVVPGAAQRH